VKRVFVHVQQNNNSYGELDGSVRVGGKTFIGFLCWVYRIRKEDHQSRSSGYSCNRSKQLT
jgi:hypothetical protein